jgi:hypothetical protein
MSRRVRSASLARTARRGIIAGLLCRRVNATKEEAARKLLQLRTEVDGLQRALDDAKVPRPTGRANSKPLSIEWLQFSQSRLAAKTDDAERLRRSLASAEQRLAHGSATEGDRPAAVVRAHSDR